VFIRALTAALIIGSRLSILEGAAIDLISFFHNDLPTTQSKPISHPRHSQTIALGQGNLCMRPKLWVPECSSRVPRSPAYVPAERGVRGEPYAAAYPPARHTPKRALSGTVHAAPLRGPGSNAEIRLIRVARSSPSFAKTQFAHKRVIPSPPTIARANHNND